MTPETLADPSVALTAADKIQMDRWMVEAAEAYRILSPETRTSLTPYAAFIMGWAVARDYTLRGVTTPSSS